MTLRELSALMASKYKLKAGNAVLCRALQSLNLRHKKLSIQATEKDLPEVKKRNEYIKAIHDVAIKDLIFIDESRANLQMAPRYGRAIGGQRVPYRRGSNITMIGAYQLPECRRCHVWYMGC